MAIYKQERRTSTMKAIILFAILSSAVCLGCTHRQQQSQPKETPDKELVNSISDAEKEKLTVLLDELRKRLDATTDTALRINAFGNGRESHTIRVDLLLKTPEWEKRFRERIIDSPALRFDGPDGQEPCELKGVNQTGNVSLAPRKATFSTSDRQAHFILQNHSIDTVSYGSSYQLAYEEDGKWYYLPTDRFFTLEKIELLPDGETTFRANLYPEINRNRPGRYRFFKEIEIGGQKELMMAEFKLAAPPIKPPTSNGLSYEYGLAAPDSTQLRACAELQDISIWTEKKVYPLDVSSVDVYVWNPTSMPFSFGRRWNLEIWKKGKWVAVKCKASVILCKDDEMSGETTPELLCFHFPVSQWYHLEKGKYRICKSFSHDGKKLALNAEFEIK